MASPPSDSHDSPPTATVSSTPEKSIPVTGGWIKLHRSILDSSVFQNSNAFLVFTYCLLRAAHDRRKFPFNRSDIELEPGEFISSHDSIRTALNKGLTISQIRTALEYLKTTGRIAIKGTNKFSIISICKWHEYQADSRQISNPVADESQTSRKRIATNKNDKELKNEKNNPPVSPMGKFGVILQMLPEEMQKLRTKYTPALVDQELTSADEWLQLAQTPKARQYRKPDHNHYLFFSGWLSRKTLRGAPPFQRPSDAQANRPRPRMVVDTDLQPRAPPPTEEQKARARELIAKSFPKLGEKI